MKAFNDQVQFKNMHFRWSFNEESSLYRDHNQKKKKNQNKTKKQSVLTWK